MATLGTEHRFTTAYHPQANATERVNRTLKTAIRAYIGDKHNSWDRYISQICFALRTAPHESTGLSPSMMLYGRELETSLDLVTQPNTDGMDNPEMTYPENLRVSIQDAHDHARVALERGHNRRKRYYDLKHRSVSYSVNDLVRVKTHPKSDAIANFTAKLAPVFSGPYRVSKVLSDVNYRLEKVDTGEDIGVFHVVNLQLFHLWDSVFYNQSKVNTEKLNEENNTVESDDTDLSVAKSCLNDHCTRVSSENLPEKSVDGADAADAEFSNIGLNCYNDIYDLNNLFQGTGRYKLRPKQNPRITSDWTVNRWTNPYHTSRFEA